MKINNFIAAPGNAYIIAEIGNNHNGSFELAKDMIDKAILAGANCVQLYTGMVYRGPNIVNLIKKELKELLLKDGVKNFNEIVGKIE